MKRKIGVRSFEGWMKGEIREYFWRGKVRGETFGFGVLDKKILRVCNVFILRFLTHQSKF